MFLDKEVVGILTIILGLIAYVSYISNMFRGTTRPHVFSWVLWGCGALIVFAGQRLNGAGAGSRSNLLTGFICLGIAAYSGFHYGRKDIRKNDIVFFILALLALVFYVTTKTWLWSIILINIADILSILPTIRKSRDDPYSETVSLYSLNTIKFLFMILATESYSFVTISNTILRVFLNFGCMIFLYIRRYKIKKYLTK